MYNSIMDNFNRERAIQTYADSVNKEIAFDLKYGTQTKTPTKISRTGMLIINVDDNSEKYPVSNGNQSCPEEYLDIAYDKLNEILLDDFEDFNLIDIGSGYGKVLLYLLTKEKHLKSYTGIEIDNDYIDISNSNKNAMSNLINVPVNFYNKDALTYDIDYSNAILFLANPFIEEVMFDFVEKNIPLIIENNSILVTVGTNPVLFESSLNCLHAFDGIQIWRGAKDGN